MSPLATFIPAFRSEYAKLELSDDSESILDRLANDDRITSSWPMIVRHLNQRVSASEFLYAILQNAKTAREFHNVPAARQEYSKRTASLVEAANQLREYFHSFPIPEVDSPKIFESAREHNAKIRQCRSLLDWMGPHIQELHRLTDASIFGRLPDTRKRGLANVTFAKLMCDYFDEKAHKPLYELVATLTGVVFNRDKPTDAEAVRAAWTSHHKAKRSGQKASPKTTA